MDISVFMLIDNHLDAYNIELVARKYLFDIEDTLLYQQTFHNYTKYTINYDYRIMPGVYSIDDTLCKIARIDLLITLTWSGDFRRSIAFINQLIQEDWKDYVMGQEYIGRMTKVNLSYICSKGYMQLCENNTQHAETLRSNYRHYQDLLEDDLSCPYVVIDLPQTDDNYRDMLTQARRNALTHIVTTKGFLNICTYDFARLLKILLREKTRFRHTFMIDAILTYTTMSISTISLILFILVYATNKSFQTMGGKNILALVISLLIAQNTYMVGIGYTDHDILCQVIGIVLHAMWLNVFSWMVICAVGIWRKLKSNGLPCRPRTTDFVKNIVVSITVPACIVIPMSVMHVIEIDAVNVRYGGSVCFLSTFQGILIGMYVPVCIMLLTTMSSFLHFTFFIKMHRNQTSAFIKNTNYLKVYVKLSTIFGFGWGFGVLANLLQFDPLWYTFYILTGLQGFFLTIAFISKSNLVMIINSLRTRI